MCGAHGAVSQAPPRGWALQLVAGGGDDGWHPRGGFSADQLRPPSAPGAWAGTESADLQRLTLPRTSVTSVLEHAVHRATLSARGGGSVRQGLSALGLSCDIGSSLSVPLGRPL